MSLRKMFKRAVRSLYNPKSAIKSLTNPAYAVGADGKSSSSASGPAAPDPQTELNDELANYKTLGDQAKAGATADAKTAGTYADTPAFQTSLQGEADAEARGLKRASLAKINAYQTQLGLPLTPAGSI